MTATVDAKEHCASHQAVAPCVPFFWPNRRECHSVKFGANSHGGGTKGLTPTQINFGANGGTPTLRFDGPSFRKVKQLPTIGLKKSISGLGVLRLLYTLSTESRSCSNEADSFATGCTKGSGRICFFCDIS